MEEDEEPQGWEKNIVVRIRRGWVCFVPQALPPTRRVALATLTILSLLRVLLPRYKQHC